MLYSLGKEGGIVMSYFRRRKSRKIKEATKKPLDACMVKNYYGCSYTVINGPVNIGDPDDNRRLMNKALESALKYVRTKFMSLWR